jgi:GNAT superfamily N-acetyltransferase
MMEINIRKGFKGDMPAVLTLINELAAYEKLPDEVDNSVEQLERDGFGDDKIFDVFVADVDGEVIGFALYYMKYSTWKGRCVFLEDLIISEAYRGKGVGAKLFERLMLTCKELQVKRMEWQVIDWNEPGINFYKKYDANFDGEWFNCKFTYDQLQAIDG